MSINTQISDDGKEITIKIDGRFNQMITEVREGTAIIRDMKKGTQKTVKMEDVVKTLVKLIGKDNLDLYSPGELVFS